jgi:hypothetical protein
MTATDESQKPEVPVAFGGTWEAFFRDWWLESSLPDTPSNISMALNTLARIWPERADGLARNSARGPAVVAPVIEVGAMLAACESRPSFDGVLYRLKGGERSAYAEMVLVSSLARLALDPSFAPPIDGRVLDAKCVAHGQQVFFEVVAPESSDASVARSETVSRLSNAVQASIKRCRVEVEISDSYTDTDLAAVIEMIAAAPPSTWVSLEDKIRIRRIDAGQALLPLFDRADGSQIFIGGDRNVQGESASAVVRHETSDARAKRIFNEEYHQFSDAVPNVLVVDVCAVSDGMKEWPNHMSRLLQPSRNRRVGAVIFFHQGVVGPPERIVRRWRVLTNPSAHLQIPEPILAGLESLDESHIYGLPRHERLRAVA